LYPNGDMQHGARRLGVLPTLSRWVRFVDEHLIEDGRPYELPYRWVACGGSCKFLDAADTVAAGDSVCTGRRLDHWPAKTVATEAGWLFDQLDYIKDQPWLYRFHGEITAMMADIRKIIGTDRLGKLICIQPGCGWPVEEHGNGAWFRCTGCQRAWSFAEIRNMAEVRRPMTIKECAERSGTSVRLLKDYVTAGKITPLKDKQGAAKLYDLGQVMEATQKLRYRKSSVKA
jgi:hypothetical protein